jgi:hypothetical protein
LRKKITRTRLALIGVAAAAVLAVAVPAALAGTFSYNGSLSPGDTQQTDRLFRDGVPSFCVYGFGNPLIDPFTGIPIPSKLDPGLLGDAALRAVDVYSFWNATNQYQCVTVRLATACGPLDPTGVNGFSTSYFFYDPADPSDPGSVYAGDAGQSGTPMQYGFVVLPFESFEVVVSTVDIDLQNCNNYRLTVSYGKTAKVTANVKGKWKAGAVDKR